MEHLAINLEGKESQICVRNGAGEIVEERRISSSRSRGIGRPLRRTRSVPGHEPRRRA